MTRHLQQKNDRKKFVRHFVNTRQDQDISIVLLQIKYDGNVTFGDCAVDIHSFHTRRAAGILKTCYELPAITCIVRESYNERYHTVLSYSFAVWVPLL